MCVLHVYLQAIHVQKSYSCRWCGTIAAKQVRCSGGLKKDHFAW